MRLTDQQIQTIRNLVREGYGTDARVCLFGSGTDDSALGGDIDLLIELSGETTLEREIALSARLQDQLGRPVDVLTTWPRRRTRPSSRSPV